MVASIANLNYVAPAKLPMKTCAWITPVDIRAPNDVSVRLVKALAVAVVRSVIIWVLLKQTIKSRSVEAG